MTVYKIKHKVEESASPTLGGTLRVVRWKILAFIEDKELAYDMLRRLQLEHPLATYKTDVIEVKGNNEEIETEGPLTHHGIDKPELH